MPRNEMLRFLVGIPVLIAIVAVWAAAAALSGQPPAILPGPVQTFDALLRLADGGQLWVAGGNTIYRMMVGWLLASILGIAIGVVIGSIRSLREYVQPFLEFVRPLPASAIMPVAILFFGLSEISILMTIAFGAIWPVLLGTIHGVTTLDRRLLDVANALRLSQAKTMISLALPNAMPDIMTGLRLSLPMSLIIAVVGEMLTSRPGLGLQILQAARSFNGPEVYSGTICLGVIGLCSNLILRRIELHTLKWRDPSRRSVVSQP